MSILERLFDYKRKFQKQGIITLRHSKLLPCSQMLSRQWLVKNKISKSLGKSKHKEMYGKLFVPTTIRSNIMFSNYLCARVWKRFQKHRVLNIFGDVTKGIAQELWYPNGTGIETIKCNPSRIMLVTKMKEKAR